MNYLDERVTVAKVAERFSVSEALVRKWTYRYGIKPNNEGLYRFGDLVEVEHRTRHARGARRKLTTVG